MTPISGEKFNKWTVVELAYAIGNGHKQKFLKCRCECGMEKVVRESLVIYGLSKSCGTGRCNGKAKHLKRNSAEWSTWQGMKRRCGIPGHPDYTGRGISVCKRWRDSFEMFIADMGMRPGKGWSIERIDNNGDYEPSNCRWATQAEQSRNTRRNRNFTVLGVTKTMKDWSIDTGVPYGVVMARLKAGWDMVDAFCLAPRKKCLPEALRVV